MTLVDSLFPEHGGNLAGIESRVSVIADERDAHSMRYLVHGQNYLFNLASQTNHMDSIDDPYTDLVISASTQLALLGSCFQFAPAVKEVFANTRQTYGKSDYLPVDVNSINKLAGEWYHILYNNVYGVRACALRLTNTYGPLMRTKDALQTFLGV